MWPRLKAFTLESDETASKQVLFMCNYCKSSIKIDKLPPRCVLNGLETVEIKAALAKLDRLSRQLIQRAKCYQTVVRLGTYTYKVPAYNSLKACKGTMFFLPLPFNNTVETVDEVIASKVLPEPELYIIINGKPTKNNVLWRDLVDVEDLNPLDPTDEFTRHFGSLHLWKPFQAQRGSKTLPVCPNCKITGTFRKKWPFFGAPLL